MIRAVKRCSREGGRRSTARKTLDRRFTRAIIGAAFLLSCAAGAETANLSGGLFRIEYAQPDEAVAQQTLDILQQGATEFSAQLPAGDVPIHVTICRSQDAFRRVAGQYGKARVGGIAKSQAGVIVVKAPYLLPEGQDYRGMLRHELIHVLLARNTDPANVPRWFDEGVAMLVSKELRWESGLRIARMYVTRRLIPYPDLNFAFAPLGDEGLFDDAYAQALSLTQYLRARLGEDRFWGLVRALRTEDFAEALRARAGLTPGALYDTWRRSLWKVALITWLVSGFSAFDLMAILVLVAYLRKRRRGRAILRQWEEEDGEPEVFSWDNLVEGPYPWEEKDEDERE